MLAINKLNPLKNCNFGFFVHFNWCLKNRNMNGKVKKTVKKYLAQVIWKNDSSCDKYLAIASMKGSNDHALMLSIIAFIKKNI